MSDQNLTKKQKIFYMLLSAVVGVSAELFFIGFIDLSLLQIDIFNVGTFHDFFYDLWFFHFLVALVAGSIGYTQGPNFFKIVNFTPW